MTTGWRDNVILNGDVRIAVRDHGGAGRPVVLIHGGPGQNLGAWDDFAPRLAADVRVAALDVRGNGVSDDAWDYSYPALVSDIHAVVRTLGLRGPLLVGHSWGGVLATYYASQYDDAGGVIAVDGWITDVHSGTDDSVWEFIEQDYATDPFLNFCGNQDELTLILEEMSREHGFAAAAVMRRHLVLGTDGMWRWRRSIKELINVERLVGDEEHALSIGLYERVTCPVLLIGGERSEWERRRADPDGRFGPWGFSRLATEPIVSRFPNVSIEWWASGHDIPHQMPEQLAETIVRASATWR